MKYRAFALIALVLCLVCLAFARAQEPVRAEGKGTSKHVQLPAHLLDHPTSILCAPQEPMGASATAGKKQQQPRRIEVPAGKNPTDLCSAIIERYYNIAPGVAYSAASYDNIPPPVGRLPNNKTTGPPP